MLIKLYQDEPLAVLPGFDYNCFFGNDLGRGPILFMSLACLSIKWSNENILSLVTCWGMCFMKRKTNPIHLGKQYLPSSSQDLGTTKMLLCLQSQAWNFPPTTSRVLLGGQSSTVLVTCQRASGLLLWPWPVLLSSCSIQKWVGNTACVLLNIAVPWPRQVFLSHLLISFKPTGAHTSAITVVQELFKMLLTA